MFCSRNLFQDYMLFFILLSTSFFIHNVMPKNKLKIKKVKMETLFFTLYFYLFVFDIAAISCVPYTSSGVDFLSSVSSVFSVFGDTKKYFI